MHIGFAGTVIATFNRIVEKAINTITIILIVFCCVKTTLSSNGVCSTW